jgi:hypothetical protein
MRLHALFGASLVPAVSALLSLHAPSAWAVAEVGDSGEAASPTLAIKDTRLHAYGFLDVGMKYLHPRNTKGFMAGVIDTKAITFIDGQLNVYADVHHGDSWRALTEVRFTSLPHGTETSFASSAGTSYERTDARVYDSSSPTGYNMLSLGSVVMERLWVQWQGSDWFSLRVGYWLTPYGIWNVHHGTPALIALIMPGFFATEDFPTHQAGLQVRGLRYVKDWEIGYVVYLSNGRTPGAVDYTNDKALGGRLVLRRTGSWDLALGASVYHDRNADVHKEIVSFAPFRIAVDETVAARDQALGVDLSIDGEHWRLRCEVVGRRIQFEEGKRRAMPNGSPGYEPDSDSVNGYVLAAYAFHLYGTRLEPYLYGEGRKNSLPTPSGGDAVLMLGAGLNVYFTSQAQWKTQFIYNPYFDTSKDKIRHLVREDFTGLASRLVLAF